MNRPNGRVTYLFVGQVRVFRRLFRGRSVVLRENSAGDRRLARGLGGSAKTRSAAAGKLCPRQTEDGGKENRASGARRDVPETEMVPTCRYTFECETFRTRPHDIR